jgi:AcrR family transcriptional regulator
VREQIIDAALALFEERGYDAVTVEQIALSVGMSGRKLHRYFASKDDIVLESYDLEGHALVTLLRSRPLNESAWVSLRQVFLDFGSTTEGEPEGRISQIDRIVGSTRGLTAGYLVRTQRIQGRLAAVLRERSAQRGEQVDHGDPRRDAVVAAAYACRAVAQTTSMTTSMSFAEALDITMDAVRTGA